VVVQELDSDDLPETVKDAMLQRRFLKLARLQASTSVPDHVVEREE
jgi:hypothetical protein